MSSHARPAAAPGYAVLVPVKQTQHAKSRLAGLGEQARRDLAAAFAVDTVSAVLACDAVRRVLVVGDDLVVAAAVSDLGADVLPDGTTDLNGTLLQAAAEVQRRDPGLRLAAVCADVPALRPEELSEAFEAADAERMSFVADADRIGTTAVIAPSVAAFRPAFGVESRRRHLEAGAVEVVVDVPGLRRDVDEPRDLETVLRLGAGPRTSLVATMLSFRQHPPAP
jgi:2-phospho-L-lactate/phosphoenolpyruvate guanylyltransferase